MRKLALGLNSIPSGNVPGSENVEVPNLNEEDIESANKTAFNAIEQSGFDKEEGLDKAVIAYNKVFNYRLGNKMRNELIKLNKALNGIGYKNLIKIAVEEPIKYDGFLNFLVKYATVTGGPIGNNGMKVGSYYYNKACIVYCTVRYSEEYLGDTETQVEVVHIFGGRKTTQLLKDMPGDWHFDYEVGETAELKDDADSPSNHTWYEIKEEEPQLFSEIISSFNKPENAADFPLKKYTGETFADTAIDDDLVGNVFKITMGGRPFTILVDTDEKLYRLSGSNWVGVKESHKKSVLEACKKGKKIFTAEKKGSYKSFNKNIKKYAQEVLPPVPSGTTYVRATPAAATPAATEEKPPEAETVAATGASTDTAKPLKTNIPQNMHKKWYEDDFAYYYVSDGDAVYFYKKNQDGIADFKINPSHVSQRYKNWNLFVKELRKLPEIQDPKGSQNSTPTTAPATAPATSAPATAPATPVAQTNPVTTNQIGSLSGVTETINGDQVVSIGTHLGGQIFLVVNSVKQGDPKFYIKHGKKVSPLGKDDNRLRDSLGLVEVIRIANTLESTKLFLPEQIEAFKSYMNLKRRGNRLGPLRKKKRDEKMKQDVEKMKQDVTKMQTSAREERLDRLKKKGVI